MTPRDRLARLHCVNALLHGLTGHDLYLADQMLRAIEAAEAVAPDAAADDLAGRVARLHETLLGAPPSAGFAFCDAAADRSAGPLFVDAELRAAVRRNAARPEAMILVANLPGSAGPGAARPSRAATRRSREHAESVALLRSVAARQAGPRSLLTLLFV